MKNGHIILVIASERK